MTSADPLLQPYALRHLVLRNRLISTAHEPAPLIYAGQEEVAQCSSSLLQTLLRHGLPVNRRGALGGHDSRCKAEVADIWH
jgi:hypothetical protein